jgi:transcriptional regulator with PAS, ATPase and Fis domain
VPVNCAAVPKELVESELFGHKKGAFTGAFTDSTGLFGAANGGTIFLDDILEMPYDSQAKLLRALQERRIRPVGGAEEVAVDVRVIASANRDLDEAITNEKFRQDLFYRLSVIRITLPPLRERTEDIPSLVRHFIGKFNDALPQNVTGITNDALEVLARYQWPGNIRELEGAIENAFALGHSEMIRRCDLPSHIVECVAVEGHPSLAEGSTPVTSMVEAEKKLLLNALKAAHGNKTHAARLLGVSRPRLYKMIQRHGVQS